mmetsp:Transcript_38213/g.76561  ORF Transcript_38213/g.76561 Transcript_38213/m.76561 type:complete len:130 (-) Transcript_38213:69-458(-)
MDVKVLAWRWQAKESKWPALAKMVKQYFAAPASSASVERVFSAAGKMHGDLHRSQGLDAGAFTLRSVQYRLTPCWNLSFEERLELTSTQDSWGKGGGAEVTVGLHSRFTDGDVQACKAVRPGHDQSLHM